MFRTEVQERCDVAVLGGGLSGIATALRLQAAGLSTVVLESHGHAGGCAGYFRQRGFSFDVGATTLVDYGPGGVGGELLDSVGAPPLDAEELPGYVAWLPDRVVTLHRDQAAWQAERLRALGDSPRHHAFWRLLDQLADTFWAATRRGVRLPMHRPADLWLNVRAVGPAGLWPARHVFTTLGAALRRHGLREDRALVALLGMLVQDTVHSTVDDAPLVNAALGVTIRGAGLLRHRGGMHGFWRVLLGHYRALGGQLVVGCAAQRVTGQAGQFTVHTARGTLAARAVVSALPAATTAAVVPAAVAALRPFLARDEQSQGGAIVVFLGVPEAEVAGQPFTHHQLLHDYAAPLRDGNNMFISVSAPGDTVSAPSGHRAVMISTHTELDDWAGLSDAGYAARKEAIGADLVQRARHVYPTLARQPVVYAVGTPRSYEHFTRRPGGAVGGVRQSLANANQRALGPDIGVDGLWLVGDSTWPGLGTVACAVASRVVAESVLRRLS